MQTCLMPLLFGSHNHIFKHLVTPILIMTYATVTLGRLLLVVTPGLEVPCHYLLHA